MGRFQKYYKKADDDEGIRAYSKQSELIRVELHKKNVGPRTDGEKRKGNAGGCRE